MAMHPMSPKLPKPAAFALLSDLNEFFSHSVEERQAAFTDYTAAVAEHEAALEKIDEAGAAVFRDLAAAAETKREAEELAQSILRQANAGAKQAIDVAIKQAETVNETARENVAAAAATVEAAEAQARALTAGLDEAVGAALVREEAAKERENVAQVAALDAAASKAEYETLIRDINALQRRAPK